MVERVDILKKQLIIFGAAEQAEICNFYFERDSDYKVVSFVIDDELIGASSFAGLPIIAWSEATKLYPAKDFDCFVALGYTKVNQARKLVYEKVKEAGYSCPSYLSSKAVVLNDRSVGDNCLILENNTIQPFVKIGSNTTIWSGNHIGHHSTIGNNVFITSHVVISGGVNIGDEAFLGVNATIRDHISIGRGSVIGAGTLIMKSTEPYSVYSAKSTESREVTSDQIRYI